MQLMSVNDAAEQLGVSARRVHQLCAAGVMGQRIGKRLYVITQSDVLAYMKNRRPPGNPNWRK